jgi:hypothetical protein
MGVTQTPSTLDDGLTPICAILVALHALLGHL